MESAKLSESIAGKRSIEVQDGGLTSGLDPKGYYHHVGNFKEKPGIQVPVLGDADPLVFGAAAVKWVPSALAAETFKKHMRETHPQAMITTTAPKDLGTGDAELQWTTKIQVLVTQKGRLTNRWVYNIPYI